MASDRLAVSLPPSLAVEQQGPVAVLRLNRAHKRNALDDDTVAGIDAFFGSLPEGTEAVVMCGEGEHFSAGLDLSELKERDIREGIAHSGRWHRAFEKIQYGKVPVVAVLHGAVVGGGLELAAAAHVRVAERSAYYALPEGSRGIYVGGGGSVRLPRLIGVARMMDMMLTGRTYSAEEGLAIGLTTYLVEPGRGLAKGSGARAAHRRQHRAHQFRHHARAAAHCRNGAGLRFRHGVADLLDRPGRPRGERPPQGLPGEACSEGDALLRRAARAGYCCPGQQ